MSKIEECYLLFKQYCKQELIYLASLVFYDDGSGDIKDDDENYILSFDNFQECVDKLKKRLK